MSTTETDVRRSLQEYVTEEIRVVLLRRRMTAEELAGAVGWSTSTISRKLSNQAKFNLDDLHRVAKALNVPLQSLLPADMDFRCSLAFVA